MNGGAGCKGPELVTLLAKSRSVPKGPDARVDLARHLLPETLLRPSGTIMFPEGVENLFELPVGVPPLMRPEISHGGCHMVARKYGLLEVSNKLLFYMYFWLRG